MAAVVCLVLCILNIVSLAFLAGWYVCESTREPLQEGENPVRERESPYERTRERESAFLRPR